MGIVTVNGVVYAERVSTLPPGPANWLTAGYVDGRKKVNMDFYVGLGTESAGSTLLMGALIPLGAKVMSISLHMNAANAGLTMSIGDLDSATRYATNLSCATKGIFSTSGFIDAVNGPYLVGQNPAAPTAADNDQQIVLTTGGATLTLNNIYGIEIQYTTD